jgi:hypothetical protein
MTKLDTAALQDLAMGFLLSEPVFPLLASRAENLLIIQAFHD